MRPETRPSWDDYFFDVAAVVSTRATCPRAAIGCVIVNPRNHRILGTGYNGAAAGEAHCAEVGCLILADHCIRATHAEVNAARQVTTAERDLVAYVVGPRDVCSHCACSLYACGVRDVRIRSAATLLDAVTPQVIAWQRATFPSEEVGGILPAATHLLREVREIEADPENAEEWADAYMLTLSVQDRLKYGALRRGFHLGTEIARKLEINKSRSWGEPDVDGVVEHVRNGAS